MMAEAQEKDQTYLVEKRKGKFNGLRFYLLRTNQSSSKKKQYNHFQPSWSYQQPTYSSYFWQKCQIMGAASKNRMFQSEIQRYHWYVLVRNFNYHFLPL